MNNSASNGKTLLQPTKNKVIRVGQNHTVDVTIEKLVSTKLQSGGTLGNDLAREEAFRDLGFGMFIHWSLDCLMGTVISHWMIGAQTNLVDQFIAEKPGQFNPKYFDAQAYALLAQQAGMKYMCFTAKHHNGFCMYNTKTTPFNIMNTPFGRDVFLELTEAFRKVGILPGVYFSPLDFYVNYQQGHTIHFLTSESVPQNNRRLMQNNLNQMKELLEQYGNLNTVFFDGPPESLKELVWKIQPQCLVTRGEMETPECELPDKIMDWAWEANYCMGESWGYKPYGDRLKTPRELIELLIKIRALGGNFLLNVSPDAFGLIPLEQVAILREMGLFVFFNQEAIYGVRPWKVSHEGKIWFTKKREENTVYAFVMDETWGVGYDYANHQEKWHDITLKSVQATENTQIELVGQRGDALEHHPELSPRCRWKQDHQGLHIHCLQSFRPYDNRQWPYPVAIRITNAR